MPQKINFLMLIFDDDLRFSLPLFLELFCSPPRSQGGLGRDPRGGGTWAVIRGGGLGRVPRGVLIARKMNFFWGRFLHWVLNATKKWVF